MHSLQYLAQTNLAHIESNLERLNERIARLAQLLGVSLESEMVRRKIIDGSQAVANDGQTSRSAQEARRRHEWAELRGLMLLRMHLMEETLKELGLEPTYLIAQLAHEHLVHEGFKPGSDGFSMLERLQAEHDRRAASDFAD